MSTVISADEYQNNIQFLLNQNASAFSNEKNNIVQHHVELLRLFDNVVGICYRKDHLNNSNVVEPVKVTSENPFLSALKMFNYMKKINAKCSLTKDKNFIMESNLFLQEISICFVHGKNSGIYIDNPSLNRLLNVPKECIEEMIVLGQLTMTS